MDISDEFVGKVLLGSVGTIFLVFVIWVNTYPFIDKDLALFSYIPDPRWGLLFCAVWGFFFVGGLMVFSMYHFYPHYRTASSSTNHSTQQHN